jgi:hypothetical protein
MKKNLSTSVNRGADIYFFPRESNLFEVEEAGPGYSKSPESIAKISPGRMAEFW